MLEALGLIPSTSREERKKGGTKEGREGRKEGEYKRPSQNVLKTYIKEIEFIVEKHCQNEFTDRWFQERFQTNM